MAESLYPNTPRTLIEKLRDGDEISWQEFYRVYGEVVRRIAGARGIPAADIDEIVQQVMLAFCRNNQNGTFRFDSGIARFRTYFGRIITAKLNDYLRRRYRENPAAGEAIADCADDRSGEDFEREWRLLMLVEAETRLKRRVGTKTFMAYSLFVKQERPVKKVAEFLGTSSNQVYQAKKRCLAILREIISEINSDDPELELEYPDNE